MTTILSDIRHATRSALRQPGLSLVIVLTLAVGIGANTAIFTLLSELYQPDVRAPDSDRLFYLRTGTGVSYLDVLVYREAVSELGQLGVWKLFGAVLGLPGQGEAPSGNHYTLGIATSPEYFELHGAGFALGRGLLAEDNRRDRPAVAVLGHAFWRRHLGADGSIVGKTIRVNNVPFTVVGVTAPGFRPGVITMPIHVPVVYYDDIVARDVLSDREAPVTCMLRLGPGVRREEVETRLATVAHNLDREYPRPEGKERHLSLRGVHEQAAGPEPRDALMAGAVGLLLLLASANVANLLLARAAGRRREMAVHAALGAPRGRVARRLLAESVLLAVAGGALGLVVGRWIATYVRIFLDIRTLGLPDFGEPLVRLELDGGVLLFTLSVSVATGCLFGLAPVVHVLRADLVAALKSSDGGAAPGRRAGARQVLVVIQVALSTVLLLGAALLVRSLATLEGQEVGFDIDHQVVAALSTAPPRDEAPLIRRQVKRELYEVGRRRLVEIPGVVAATLTSDLPASGFVGMETVVLPEQPGQQLKTDRMTIGPDFFETFGYALLQGRTFDAGDRAGGPGVVIVNRAFVERFWSDGQPLGRELSLPNLVADTVNSRFVVVGVAEDVRHVSRRYEPAPLVYVSLAQHLRGSRIYAVARTAGPPRQVLRQARETLATAHPDLALIDVATYDLQTAVDLFSERLTSTVARLFSLFGLGLACLGIYSVMSWSVSSRLRDLGIRLAVGATARDLVRLVLREAFGLVVAGILIGAAAALGLARVLSSLLHGVTPHDPATFLLLPPVLAAIGAVAAWRPAWRAGRVDPKIVLQEE